MEEYKASLTGEPFLYNETKTIGKYLLDGENSLQLRKRNVKENLIQYKQPKSISRVNSAIFKRLTILDKKQLNFLVNEELQQSKYMLIYSIMKTDNIVKDFIREVYYDKLLMNDTTIQQYEVEKWFNNKCDISEFLNSRSESTKYKLKQVLMQIMNASGLVKREKNTFYINRPLLSDEFIKLLSDAGDYEFAKTIGGLI
jgi:hypothetical protein